MEEDPASREEDPEAKFSIEGMNFSQLGISMLAGLVQFMQEGSADDGLFTENQVQSMYYRRFRRVSAAVLSGLFLLLLINFLVFSSVKQNLDRLKTSGESQAQTIREIEQLEAQIEEYRNLSLNRIRISEQSYSFYLEELARNRPSGVWFNQLTVDPIQSKQEAGKALETNRSQIRLTGETRDPVTLNKFISALKDLNWVLDIELKNYAVSGESQRAAFEIVIRKADEI
jgi:Tfp pilus assembly protein PilN